MNSTGSQARKANALWRGAVGTAIMSNRRLLLASLGFSAVMSILALTTSFYMLQVYDRVLTSRSGETLTLLTLISAGALVVFGWLDSLRLRLHQRLAVRTAESIGKQALRAMVATASQSGGMAIRGGLRDLDTLRGFMASPALGYMADAPFVIIYFVVLALLHWMLLATVVVGGAILCAIAYFNHVLADKSLAKSLESQQRAHNLADDGLRNSDVLEGMGMSATFVEKWHEKWVEGMRIGTFAFDRDATLTSSSRVVRMMIQVALLGVGAYLILHFEATGGIMIAASIIGGRALAPIESGVSTWKNALAAYLAIGRLDDILANAPKRDEGMPLPAPQGAVTATQVGFANMQARKIVLANISFELAPGESMGVIGPSASGKSTLLRLLVGAWPCSQGTARLDGADIYAWPRSDLRRYIGYLPQDIELFSGTIRENIARMTPGDPAEVVKAAQRAGAHEMILALPNGYDTEIGSRGYRLSGGQAQRIGIARALYGDPRFVVLDEPNSNLDGAGEDALLRSISAFRMEGVTAIIVSHRPSILAGVDKILALRADGTIEAYGPRNDVIRQYTKAAVPTPTVVRGGAM